MIKKLEINYQLFSYQLNNLFYKKDLRQNPPNSQEKNCADVFF